MEASEHPTIDALISEVEALAQQAAEALKNNPQVQEVQARFNEVRQALGEAKAAQPAEGAPPA